ncbi:MAG: phosphoribosylanthranilate isomerase [Bacillota bacterium]|nr:phosphoribosylanthranilate isomerase [Bacillota bacterium]
MTRVKMCGLMNQKDIDLCVQAGVHVIGFVVDYPVPVPWNLTKTEAGKLIAQVPPFVSTCVVTGGTPEKVLDVVNVTVPDMVQLHYRESLKEISEIAHNLSPRGIKTVKALRIDAKGRCDFEIEEPAQAVRELAKTGISAILVDSYTQTMPGGTGVSVDLQTFKTIQKESFLPVILAGGLHQANIIPVIREVKPYAVDVLTGVEEKPGMKDASKVKAFMENVKSSI